MDPKTCAAPENSPSPPSPSPSSAPDRLHTCSSGQKAGLPDSGTDPNSGGCEASTRAHLNKTLDQLRTALQLLEQQTLTADPRATVIVLGLFAVARSCLDELDQEEAPRNGGRFSRGPELCAWCPHGELEHNPDTGHCGRCTCHSFAERSLVHGPETPLDHIAAAVRAGAELKSIELGPMWKKPAEATFHLEVPDGRPPVELEPPLYPQSLELAPISGHRALACQAPGCSLDATWALVGPPPRRPIGYSCSGHIHRLAGEVSRRGGP